jgi:lipopolysaccharide biosynthesis protein
VLETILLPSNQLFDVRYDVAKRRKGIIAQAYAYYWNRLSKPETIL